jgi:hypothetical protein
MAKDHTSPSDYLKMTALLVAAAVSLTGCFPCLGPVTSDVNGVVINKDDKEPVEGARVSSSEYFGLETKTDVNGRFFLKHKIGMVLIVPLGDRITVTRLLVEKDGYRVKAVDLFAWPAGAPVDRTVELEPVEADRRRRPPDINVPPAADPH